MECHTIRQHITNIASRIADKNPNSKESLFDALDKIITNSCNYIEVQVKLGGGDILGSDDTLRLEAKKKDILIRLTAEIETINFFCESEGLAPLTRLSSEEFAYDLAKEYYENRSR